MRVRAFIATLAVCPLLSCGGSQKGATAPATVTATVQGRLATALQGAAATVLRVQADGTLQAVSAPAPLDSSGHYAAQVTVKAAVSDLVVQIAASGQTVSEAIVSAMVTNGATVTAPPADDTTWAQTLVFLDAQASGLWNGTATTAGLRALIGTDLADAMLAGGNADVHGVAVAAVAALDARGGMINNSDASVLVTFLAGETAAQVAEDTALDAAGSPLAVNAATTARASATISAATTAGLSLSQYAEAARAESIAYTNSSTGVAGPVAAAMATDGAEIESAGVIASDAHALTVLNAVPATVADLSAAAVDLQTAIATSAGAAEAIATAWEDYEGSALTDVKAAAADLRQNGGYNIDSATNELAGDQRTAQQALVAAASQVIVQTLSTFVQQTMSAVEVQDVLATFSSAQMAAVASVLVSIELRGGSSPPLGGSITGRLAAVPSGAVSVTAYQAASDGTLTAVSTPVMTSSAGQYTIAVTTPYVTDAIVVATSGGTTVGQVIVTGQVPGGGTLTAAPIDQQTTIEAALYLSALAHGYWSGNDTTAALRGYMSSGIAAAISASPIYDADVQLTAKLLSNAIDARQDLLSLSSIGIAASSLMQFISAETTAQQTEDGALDAATSASQTEDAIQARVEAELAAAATADMSPGQFSLATLAVTRAVSAGGSGISPAVASAIEANIEQLEADFIAQADGVEFNAFPAVPSDLAGVEATLEANVTNGPAAAWAQFDETVQNDLETAVNAAEPGGGSAVQSAKTSSMQPYSQLQSQLTSAGSDAGAIAQAYATFGLGLQSAIAADTALSALGAVELSAIACVIVNLDAAN